MLHHTIVNLLIQLPTPKHHHESVLLSALPERLEVRVAGFDGGFLEFALHFVFGEAAEGEAGFAALVFYLGGVGGFVGGLLLR